MFIDKTQNLDEIQVGSPSSLCKQTQALAWCFGSSSLRIFFCTRCLHDPSHNSHSSYNMNGKNCTSLFHRWEFRRPLNSDSSTPFFSFDTFPRSSTSVNRCYFYPLGLFTLCTHEATLFRRHLWLYYLYSGVHESD